MQRYYVLGWDSELLRPKGICDATESTRGIHPWLHGKNGHPKGNLKAPDSVVAPTLVCHQFHAMSVERSSTWIFVGVSCDSLGRDNGNGSDSCLWWYRRSHLNQTDVWIQLLVTLSNLYVQFSKFQGFQSNKNEHRGDTMWRQDAKKKQQTGQEWKSSIELFLVSLVTSCFLACVFTTCPSTGLRCSCCRLDEVHSLFHWP